MDSRRGERFTSSLDPRFRLGRVKGFHWFLIKTPRGVKDSLALRVQVWHLRRVTSHWSLSVGAGKGEGVHWFPDSLVSQKGGMAHWFFDTEIEIVLKFQQINQIWRWFCPRIPAAGFLPPSKPLGGF